MSNHPNLAGCGAIIAGTGFEEAFGCDGKSFTVETPYGSISAKRVPSDNGEIVLLPRHGPGHDVPPHRINVHGQMWALNRLGVKWVLATSAVGSLRRDRRPGAIIVIDDFIDNRGAVTTFFDGHNEEVKHVDFTAPFSAMVRAALIDAAADLELQDNKPQMVYQMGTYLCVSGPRYETPAEVRLFRAWGADVVGMTVAPEAILARELGVEYGAVSVVTNFGTGISKSPLSHAEVTDRMARSQEYIVSLFRAASRRLQAKIDL